MTLGGLLGWSSIIEQWSFHQSFMEKVAVGDSKVKMYYTIPIPPSSLTRAPGGVIPYE